MSITTVNQILKIYKETTVLGKKNNYLYLVLLTAGTVLLDLLLNIAP